MAAREERVAELESKVEHPDIVRTTEPSSLTRPIELAVVPGANYRLLEIDGRELARGDTLELDGVEYVVVRTGTLAAARGSSPLCLSHPRIRRLLVVRQLVDAGTCTRLAGDVDHPESARGLGGEELGDGHLVVGEAPRRIS